MEVKKGWFSLKKAALTCSDYLRVPLAIRQFSLFLWLSTCAWLVLTLTTIGKVRHLCHKVWTQEINRPEPPQIINVIAVPSATPFSVAPSDKWFPIFIKWKKNANMVFLRVGSDIYRKCNHLKSSCKYSWSTYWAELNDCWLLPERGVIPIWFSLKSQLNNEA